MLKENLFHLPKFPHKHEYTWSTAAVEKASHPLLSRLNLDVGTISKDAFSDNNIAVKEPSDKDIVISKILADASKSYFKENIANGEWKWINENRRANYLAALKSADVNKLANIYSNLFREDASYGIVSSTYSDFCDPVRQIKVINGILWDLDTWLDYTNVPPEEYLNMPNVGMPYGVYFGEYLVSPDICRHDCHALIICNILEDLDSSADTVLEIGGGYGGAAYQFFKRNPAGKYQWIIVDLFETLCMQYYFLTSCGIKVSFSFDGNCEQGISQVVLVPADVAEKINRTVDIVYNCHSLSEMDRSTIERYFDLINSQWKPRYLFHINSDVLLFPDSPRHIEILCSQFPIGNAYRKIYRAISPWSGGCGRNREYLYVRRLKAT
ncbi:putative sugar O-methyltransferase [Candidatus Magnetominusculus dajiuhuensis]|uniref:putative sugar O-methyltransferase n=1 Tax=Candidatus Magnetominusculus dajiuhuensis TaxID=3137712 RepID=UPI003B438EA7